MRRRELILGGASVLLLGRAATSAPPPPGYFEQSWDAMLRAPIHLQAEMVAEPAIGFGAYGRFVGEAVARAVFRGGDALREGARFRFVTVARRGTWFLRPDAPDMPMPTDPPLFAVDPALLRTGTKLELFLEPDLDGPPDSFQIVTHGLRTVEAFGAPRFDPRERPAHYDRRYGRGDPAPERARSRVRREPPAFPTRDTVLDYVVTASWGRQEATGLYHAASQRVRVTPRAGAAPGDLLVDRTARLVARIWERERTYALLPGRDGERYGHAILPDDPAPVRLGEETVIGHACTVFAIPRSGRPDAVRVWLSADGVQLKRIEGGTVMEARGLRFADVALDRVRIPAAFRRVPEERGAWEQPA
ncbi:hypothetical protein [Muricoccus radiodurans]|uniref:hypothetical protein n=1 Tax=Muricoccus radiodurans TaxID=2231721 RepID=UPI003CF2907B